MLKKIISILIAMLLVASAFSQAPQLMRPRVELQFPYKLKTYTGITTKLDISASVNDTGVYIRSFKWDLYSDNKTVKTVTGNTIQCVYPVAGKTRTTVTALLNDGSSAQISFNVEVIAGSGAQYLQFESIPSLMPLGSSLKSAQYKPSNGKVNKYAILMHGCVPNDPSDGAYSTMRAQTQRLYSKLKSDFGYTDANIQYLQPLDAIEAPLAGEVDAATSIEALRDAFIKVNSTIDSDDLLFVALASHGDGYYDASNFSDYSNYTDGGKLGRNVRLIENGSEVSESNFKLRILNIQIPNGPKLLFNGLNKWQVIIDKKVEGGIKTAWCYRVRLRADADADALLELEVDYLKGDTSKYIPYPVYLDGSFSSWDFNHNGLGAFKRMPGYDADSIPDESEWNNTPTILIDNYGLNSSQYINFKKDGKTIQRNYVLYDKKIGNNAGDGKLDFAFYDDPNADRTALSLNSMTVNGTDTDNDGLIDYTDLNGDGDHSDSWDIDELVIAGGWNNSVYSTDVAEMLNAMGNPNTIVWAISCFSGGFIKHISAPGRTICTATQDRNVGNSDAFVFYNDGLDKPTGSIYRNADINKDNMATMVECYNYAYEKTRQGNSISQSPRYNDNGDGNMYLGPIGAKPEAGCFGSSMTLSGYTGYSQVISSIANQTASTAVNYTATDVTVQNLTIKPTGKVNIHTLPSLNGKISLGVMTIEPGGRLVIDKQFCK